MCSPDNASQQELSNEAVFLEKYVFYEASCYYCFYKCLYTEENKIKELPWQKYGCYIFERLYLQGKNSVLSKMPGCNRKKSVSSYKAKHWD
ncbi:hypothetical protein AVEN_98860-1 [Araneus ventricosus]|uniref:Uncharacterized protein n=1 Tax=Araneus ventricosus TaxID=182803 RepID=A0A4Y2QL39_ARAVE|nr:hypothetical protein AVEN_98860-1 [Araneus ventricosus]